MQSSPQIIADWLTFLTLVFHAGFFYKGEQIRREVWIYSHFLKKSLTENFFSLCGAKEIFIG